MEQMAFLHQRSVLRSKQVNQVRLLREIDSGEVFTNSCRKSRHQTCFSNTRTSFQQNRLVNLQGTDHTHGVQSSRWSVQVERRFVVWMDSIDFEVTALKIRIRHLDLVCCQVWCPQVGFGDLGKLVHKFQLELSQALFVVGQERCVVGSQSVNENHASSVQKSHMGTNSVLDSVVDERDPGENVTQRDHSTRGRPIAELVAVPLRKLNNAVNKTVCLLVKLRLDNLTNIVEVLHRRNPDLGESVSQRWRQLLLTSSASDISSSRKKLPSFMEQTNGPSNHSNRTLEAEISCSTSCFSDSSKTPCFFKLSYSSIMAVTVDTGTL
ncbi:hypothetical protein OGAPHI_005735 [Ogataea philodendri]|uniref:Uncharacterized protein n=1 Tax=Ogataea philodendri TaxID=1378263 RepID=A0A9P8NYC4_9ASCO|nr:uncharacterized protein OGAPHI_005735 [Ogataea philodendri]KAH3662483.1 hypothetical protein OGAPHI_005735 [Ogataea philodendri]